MLPVLAVMLYFNVAAQTILAPGDLAVIAHNNDNADQVVLVSLVPVAQGTVIRITDNAWTGSTLTTNEGTWTYTFPSAVPAGTGISLVQSSPGVVSAGTWDLSTSGDQLFIYQGTAVSPAFVYGFSSRPWVTGTTSLTTSRLPATLINGRTARDFSTEVDNGYYNATTTSGNKDFILTQIGTTTRWTRSNNRYSAFPAITFTVSSLAAEPPAQPSGFNTSGLQTWTYQVNWSSPATPCDGILVLRSDNGDPVNGVPVDGMAYAIGDQIGNAKVAWAGTGISFIQKGGVAASRTYQYALFAYNGTGVARNYRQASPLYGSVSTPSTGEGGYYSTIDTASPSFVTSLQTRIRSPFTSVAYAQFDETIVSNVEFYDTTGGQKVATCVYSGQRFAYTPPFAWTPTTPFSREHTWCHSWMPSSASTSTNEYTDQHHLFVVNQNSANAVRSNHPLGEVFTTTSSFLGGTYGTDAGGNLVYEPVESHKGNAARALLYMSLRYNGVNGMNWTFNHLNNVILPALNEDPQDIQLLLQWHFQDPPDGAEIARNDYIQSIQGNRNPFVDRPGWVNLIDFNQVVTARIGGVRNEAWSDDQDRMAMQVYPNPVVDLVNLRFESEGRSNCLLQVISNQGKLVYSENYQLSDGVNRLAVDLSDLADGFYTVIARLEDGMNTTRIIKAKSR